MQKPLEPRARALSAPQERWEALAEVVRRQLEAQLRAPRQVPQQEQAWPLLQEPLLQASLLLRQEQQERQALPRRARPLLPLALPERTRAA